MSLSKIKVAIENNRDIGAEQVEYLLSAINSLEHFNSLQNDAMDGDIESRNDLVSLYKKLVSTNCSEPQNLSNDEIGSMIVELIDHYTDEISDHGALYENS